MPIPRIKIENLLACLRGNPVRKCKLKSAPYFAISIQRRYFSGFESAFREEKRAIDKIPDGNAAIINDIQLSPTSFRPELREAAPSIGFGPFQLYPAARILLWTGPRQSASCKVLLGVPPECRLLMISIIASLQALLRVAETGSLGWLSLRFRGRSADLSSNWASGWFIEARRW
jgi:hypothetical protein